MFEKTWNASDIQTQLPLSYDFYWDGNDVAGRRIYGAQSVLTRVGYAYLGHYERTPRFGYPGTGVQISAPTGRIYGTLWQEWTGTMQNWDAKQSGLGGWDLDVHHGYDPLSGTIHLGTGDEQPVPASLAPMQTITTTWGNAGGGGPLVLNTDSSQNGGPITTGTAVDNDGSVYFVAHGDASGNRIGRISRDKFVPGGDGTVDVWYGPGATSTPPNPTPPNPVLQAPSGLAIGPDHQLYVCDTQSNRIIRIDPITHLGIVFAGDGAAGDGSDSNHLHSDGPALTSHLAHPFGIAVAPDGTVYFTEGEVGQTSGSIRQIRDGQITTLVPLGNARYASSIVAAKDGSVYYALTGQTFNAGVYKIAMDGTRSIYAGGVAANAGYSDGGPATATNLANPNGLALSPDGLLYIADTGHNTIRRVGADGVISTVVGTPLGGVSHDGKGNSPSGLAPLSTLLNTPVGVAFDGAGMLYITDNANQKIRTTSSATLVNGPGYIPSADGAHLYQFDANFQHIKTVDAHTGIPEYFFRYSAGLLIGISNRDLNDPTRLETQIVRDSDGTPTQIISPFGQTTTLSVVGGQLLSITDPSFGVHGFSYYPGGLIQTLADPTFPSNVSYAFEFTNGQLSKDTDPYGNSQRLAVSEVPGVPGSQRVTYTDQLSRNTYYDISQPDPTTMISTVTTPDGLSTLKSTRIDGTASYVAPNQVAYSSRQSNPDGSSAYWQTANDGVSGVRSPFVSSRLDFMGSTTDPVRTTSSTRSPTLGDSSDLSSVSSFSQTDSVNGRATVLSYSKNSQTFTTTSLAGRTTTRQVDAFGRTASFQVGSLVPTVFTYDDSFSGTGTGTQQLSLADQNDGVLDRQTAYTYFPIGSGSVSGYLQQIARSQLGSPGQTTTFTRDSFGRVLTSTVGADASTFTWDGNGNLSSVTPPAGSAHDEKYTYLNQLLTYLPPALPLTTPPTPANTGYTYTPDRKLFTENNPDGLVTTRSYDAVTGRLSGITGFAGAGSATNYTYFPLGDLAPGHSPGAVKLIGRSGGVNLGFTYVGRLMASASWSGSVNGSVAWSYDNDFVPVTETITDAIGGSAAIKFGYTDLDHLLTCASLTACPGTGTDALAVAHDSNGLLSGVNFGTLTEAYGYNSFGELASKTAKLGTTPLLQSTYDSPGWVVANRRDALGRISHREETILNGTTTTFDYIYSAEGRLTDVKKGGASWEHYDYSTQNGNRIAGNTPLRNVSSAQVQYDYPQDRLRQYGPYSYTYTNNGELKTKTDNTTSPAKVTTYAYDTLGNLLSVTPAGGQAITYVIDGMNRRVGKLVGGTTVKQWLYRDSLKPVSELDGQGHLVSTFVYGSNSNVPDYMVRGGKTYRVLTDQLGSPRMVVNVLDSTDVAFSAEYTAFGERTVTAGATDFLPFGFAAGMFDSDTGLVRFGARDYDPVVGRWTAKDPTGFRGRQTNLYVYVGNDPVNSRDPAGTLSTCDYLVGTGLGLLCAVECIPAGSVLTPPGAACNAACGALAIWETDGLCHPPPPKAPPSGPNECSIGPTPPEPGESSSGTSGPTP